MEPFDILVVGGGHNGLTVGAYLQKLGFKVCVIEQYHKIGGGVITEELTLPGFKHDPGAVTHTLIRNNPLIKDDELGLINQYGLEYIIPEIPLVAIYEDGSAIFVYKDLEKTVESISQISKDDAISYREFIKWGEEFRELMQIIANRFEPLEEVDMASSSFLTKLAQYFKMKGCLLKYSPLQLYSLLTGTFMDVVDYWFKHPKVRTFVAKMGSKTMVSPLETGTAIPGTIATLGNHSIGAGLPKGGSGALSEALGRCLTAQGGEILTGTEVTKVLIEHGEAKGVRLKDGTEIRANAAVISSINVKQLFGKLIEETALPPNFFSAIRRLKHSSYSSICAHLALNEPPAFKTREDVSKAYRIELMSTVEHIFEELKEIGRGIVPTNPSPTVLVPTIHDASRAPVGKHTLWLYSFAPYDLKELGPLGWDQIKETVGDGLVQRLNTFSGNMTPDNILARHMSSPLDLERDNPSFIDGDHEHLSHILSQMTFNRPIPGWARYRTPINKLYMCGASTHPSGGVTGGGRAAVQIIINDLGLKGKLKDIIPKS